MAVARRAGVRSSRAGALAVSVAVAAWGVNNIILKLTSLPALEFAFYRLWVGAAAMLAVLAATRRRLTWPMVKASAPAGAVLGVEIMFFFSALKLTGVADVLTISALQPALTLLVAGRLFGESVTRREVSLTAVSIAGVVLVTVGASGTPVWSLRGDLLAVAALLCWTAYFLMSKRVRGRVPALEYMTAVTFTAALVVTPVVLLSGGPLGAVHAHDWLWLALFVLGGSGGHLLVAWAHPRVDVTVSSLLTLSQPVISGVAALIVLGEPLTPLEIAGGAVVIASVAAIVRRATRTGARDDIAAPEAAPG